MAKITKATVPSKSLYADDVLARNSNSLILQDSLAFGTVFNMALQ